MDSFLIKQALLGTDKTGKHIIPPETESVLPLLSDLFRKLDERDTEVSWKLLLAAGISSLADQAGYIPETTEIRDCDRFCPSDSCPVMPQALANVLFDLLRLLSSYNDTPTSIEFLLLKRVVATETRLPDKDIPRFLQLFSRYVRYKTDTEFVPRLLGEKGRWLGTLHSTWQWCSGVPLKEDSLEQDLVNQWNEGTFPERKQALSLLRQQNPDLGRTLLEATWKSEKADHRDTFLQILEKEVNDADIPFLEKAMTDRSSVVRNTATNLLLLLPNSSLSQRSMHRANKILAGNVLPDYDLSLSEGQSVSAVGLSGFKLTPPQKYTQDMKEDQIAEKPSSGFGQQGWWLTQSVTRIPLTHWEEFFGRTPEQIFELYREDEFFPELFCGWVYALAEKGGSSEWFRLLWSCSQDLFTKSLKQIMPTLHNLLITNGVNKDMDQLKKIVLSSQVQKTDHDTQKAAWIALAEREPVPWNDEFAQQFGKYLINNPSASLLIIKFLPVFPESWYQRIFEIMTQAEVAQKHIFRCNKSDKEIILNELALCQKFNRIIAGLQHKKSNQKG